MINSEPRSTKKVQLCTGIQFRDLFSVYSMTGKGNRQKLFLAMQASCDSSCSAPSQVPVSPLESPLTSDTAVSADHTERGPMEK